MARGVVIRLRAKGFWSTVFATVRSHLFWIPLIISPTELGLWLLRRRLLSDEYYYLSWKAGVSEAMRVEMLRAKDHEDLAVICDRAASRFLDDLIK